MLVGKIDAANQKVRTQQIVDEQAKRSRRSYARDFLRPLVVNINTAVSSPYAAQLIILAIY